MSIRCTYPTFLNDFIRPASSQAQGESGCSVEADSALEVVGDWESASQESLPWSSVSQGPYIPPGRRYADSVSIACGVALTSRAPRLPRVRATGRASGQSRLRTASRGRCVRTWWRDPTGWLTLSGRYAVQAWSWLGWCAVHP